jgi:hypothetical protein
VVHRTYSGATPAEATALKRALKAGGGLPVQPVRYNAGMFAVSEAVQTTGLLLSGLSIELICLSGSRRTSRNEDDPAGISEG